MYHEIEVPGHALCESDPGYVRYVVKEDDFRQQVSWLKQQNVRGLSVDQAIASDAPDGVVFTFDDGCATDLVIRLGIGAVEFHDKQPCQRQIALNGEDANSVTGIDHGTRSRV